MANQTLQRDTIRIGKDGIHFKMNVIEGKDGNFFIRVSPAFGISGYGATEREAEESFNENIKIFCSDLLSLKNDQREIELSRLGFKKEFAHNRNFSRLYVDNDGVLQGLDPGSIKSTVLEETILAA